MERRNDIRRPRPWRRTRAYRLTRTVVLTVALAVGGVWWARVDDPAPAPVTATDGAPAAPSTGTGQTGDSARAVREPTPTPTPTPPTVTGRPEPAVPARTGGPVRGRPGSVTRTPPVARPARPAAPRGPALLPRSRPTKLTVPYLDVEAPVVDLHLDRHGQLTAPPADNSNLAGWYADGPSPGENGTVIVVGHRDTRAGAAVFIGLDEVTPGRLIELRRADGRTAVYTVDAVKTYDKAHFPSKEVYGARARPELRLITCGGGYDRRTGYSGNIVVYAHLTATRPAPSASPGRGDRARSR
ncbi:class F sortase [Streptomyces sp. WI04-05B]|uniref:class F sortase n=1 Tax=Streptomyces TaxID=1883 RepID=UPI0029BC9861|nr:MULTISPECIES: class F sortase [unclassified Streptomyces]MDX2540997.1 class F sortase [Streptomyces sp. WI04-05B]MDX2586114.1 class F sortase [Streptomyces sp. WI04-05A]